MGVSPYLNRPKRSELEARSGRSQIRLVPATFEDFPDDRPRISTFDLVFFGFCVVWIVAGALAAAFLT
jgi:hypothetical protein